MEAQAFGIVVENLEKVERSRREAPVFPMGLKIIKSCQIKTCKLPTLERTIVNGGWIVQKVAQKPTSFRMAAVVLLPSILWIAWTVQPAVGWGREGHVIISMIAERRLTPSARAQVQELLGNATLWDVANWADDVRKDRPETRTWHYVNIPVGSESYDPLRDVHEGSNILIQLQRWESVLADRSAAPEQRLEALKWVVHLVGDLSQPLHCVTRDDRGGNTRLVHWQDQGRAINLHLAWDVNIVTHLLDTDKPSVYASALDARIARADRQNWEKGDFIDWANEGYQIAVEVVYRDVPPDGPPPRLGDEYIDRAAPVAAMQLQKAAVRLAFVLNRALSDPGDLPHDEPTEQAPSTQPAMDPSRPPATQPATRPASISDSSK
jgi:hypothetical protein